MYIGISKFTASTSNHKPLDVFRIQQEVAYILFISYNTGKSALLNIYT